jgi:formylglycine-generating enzyme required for sulfatase activity
MMAYPPEEEAGGGADRARFSGLTRPQVEVYVRLAGAVESAPAPVEAPADLLSAFLSGDVVKIGEAAGRLEEQEAEPDGPLRQAVRAQLAAVLSDPRRARAQRLSAGEVLGRIGDPRFHDAGGFFLPREELLGFVEIPAGQFRMGSDPQQDPQAQKKEQPQHSLHLERFFLARYPVTVAQFRLFVEQSGHKPADESSIKGAPNYPVRYVTWYDAIAYCEWLTDALRQWAQTPAALRLNEGWAMTLPSEAEWEKAARGVDARLYPWGNEFDPDKANHKGTGLENPSAVGCFPGGASSYGLLDMSGNVWEWTRSLWGEWDRQVGDFKSTFGYPYQPDDGREDLSRSTKWGRVLRGGANYNDSDYMRCAFRNENVPLGRGGYDGFRVCVSPISRDAKQAGGQ